MSYSPPAPFGFGNVQIGDTSVQQVITITNTGAEEIQFVSDVFSTSPDFVVEGASGDVCQLNFTLAGGASCTVRVTFQPENGAPGPRNGGLGFLYLVDPVGGPGGFVTTSYALQGNAVVGELSAAPNPVNFGDRIAGPPSAPETVTLTNDGDGPLRIDGTEIVGADQGAFELITGSDNCSNTTLAEQGQPGDSCTVQVRFNVGNGANTGERAAALRFNVQSAANGPYPAQKFDVPLQANIVSGVLSVSPSNHNFADRQIGTWSAPVTFTVTNNSVGPIEITNLDESGPNEGSFDVMDQTCDDVTLQPGATCTFQVAFTPVGQPGQKNNTIFITHTGSNGDADLEVNVSGLALAPVLGINTAQLTFPDTQVGTSSMPLPVTVTNNGTGPLTIDTLSVILGSDQFDIVGNVCDGVVLAPNGSCTVYVVFSPPAATPIGLKSGQLSVTHSGSGDPTIIELQGNAVAGSISVTPAPIVFGPTEVNTTSPTQMVTIENTGTGPIAIGAITAGAGFSVLNNNCTGQSLAAGDDCTIQVVFEPTAATPSFVSEPLTINYGAGSSVVVALIGTVSQTPLSITPAGPVNFGNVVIGQTAYQFFTVKNEGAADVVIPAGGATVAPTPPFTEVSDTCDGQTLVPGETCTILVAFTPDAYGPVAGTLSINPVVQLLGFGVNANGALVTSTPQLTFGPQQAGSQSGTQQVIITNPANSGEPVTIDSIVAAPTDYIPLAGAGANCQATLVLDPGESCVIWLAFQPGAGSAGDINGTLTINYTSDSLPDGQLIILLRGTATTPNGTVDPLQLNFGAQEINTTSGAQTVRFTNNGLSTIVVPTVTKGGPDGSQFVIQTDGCSGATVQPGNFCEVSVVFRPDSVGAKFSSLNIGALPNPRVVTLTGVGIDPILTITPVGPVDFGNVIVDGPGGNYSLRSFTVTNNSQNPVVVPAPLFSNTAFGAIINGNDCPVGPAELGPGASCTIVVYFDPTTVGEHNGTLQVNPIVLLTGTGVAADGTLSVTPAQLTFGSQQVGTQSAVQQVIVSNNGNIPVSIGSVVLSGANYQLTPGGAGSSCVAGTILATGESCSFWVAFQPTGAGALNEYVSINYSSAQVNPGVISVLLRGNGITPVLAIAPNNLVFGPQTLFTASAAQTVTVANSSNGPLTLGALSVTNDDFRLVANTCTNATLAPGASCTFSVIFLPDTATGPQNGSITIPVAGLNDIVINAFGQALAAQQGGLSFSPAFVDFGFQQVASPTAPKPITITNNGNAVVEIQNISFAGLDVLDFFPLIGDDCEGKFLNPGQSCTVFVRYRPLTTGLSEAYLVYDTNLAGSPHAVYLYGVGITPSLEISSVQLNFGNLQVGNVSAPQTVTVKNMSQSWVTLDLDGPYTGDYELVGAACNNATLAPLQSCNFSVTFRPQGTGVQTDAIDIEISPGGLVYEVDLLGVGLTPNGMVAPLQLNFGNVQVGTTSNVQTVRYTNIGSGPIALPEVNLAGPDAAEFLIQTDSCSNATVPNTAPINWCEVSVVFRPQTQGAKNAQLSIGPALHNPDVVTLQGNGTVPSPNFQAASIDFGNQVIDTTSATKKLTVTNNGPGTLEIFGTPQILGANAGDFTIIVNGCEFTSLAPGQSCALEINFKPSALGLRTAYVSFITNLANPNLEKQVPLSGTGVPVPTYLVTTSVSNGVGANCSVNGPAGPFQGDEMPAYTLNAPAGSSFIGWELNGYYVGFASPLDFKINNSSHTLEAICVATPSFNDIAGSPYQNAIEQMAAFGFIKGYQGLSGPYGPTDNVLRSQMAVIMVRMANRTNAWGSEVHPNPFGDQCNQNGCVDAESWGAVATGYEKQVIRGLGFGVFGPFNNVTEMEVVAFVTRLMQATTLELEQHGRLPGCPVPQQGTPASDPLGTAVGCPVPPQQLSGQPANMATKWESQPNNGTVYGSVPDGSGFRKDISTYFYYAGVVPGTGNQFNAWPTWSTAAKREHIAAIMWNAYASYWGTDRVDQLP